MNMKKNENTCEQFEVQQQWLYEDEFSINNINKFKKINTDAHAKPVYRMCSLLYT